MRVVAPWWGYPAMVLVVAAAVVTVVVMGVKDLYRAVVRW